MKMCAEKNTSEQERHESWMKMTAEAGFVYGEKFDSIAKTHPNMLPWDQLPAEVKSKARIFDIVAKAALKIKGFSTDVQLDLTSPRRR